MIFEKLREINTLVNYRRDKKIAPYGSFWRRKQVNIKPLRFLYLLRDDIFTNKDRTKFFDFIIPVVPVVGASNSYNIFKKIFDEYEGILVKPDPLLLREISIHINDMRILKNIFNEFKIYYECLEKNTSKNIIKPDQEDDEHADESIINSDNEKHDNKKPDSGDVRFCSKMVAMITYKNLFPHDFDCLHLNKGFVFALLDNRKVSLKKFFVDKCNKLKVGDKKTEKDEKIIKQIEKLEKIIKQIEKRKVLKDIITDNNMDDNEIFSITIKNEIGMESDFKDIYASEYFSLLKFLIRDGHISESYAKYMAYSHNDLWRTDEIFVLSVKKRKKIGPDYSLKQPEKVITWLLISDFNQPGFSNFDLFNHLLEAFDKTPENRKYLKAFFEQLERDRNYDFLEKALKISIKQEYKNDNQWLFGSILNCNELDNAHYRTILSTISLPQAFSIKNIDDDRILTLIGIGIIPESYSSSVFLRDMFPLEKILNMKIRPDIELKLFELILPSLDEDKRKKYSPFMIKMVPVKGGTFNMGCTSEQDSDCRENEMPLHKVTVSDFYIGKYIVTHELWAQVMDVNQSPLEKDKLPFVNVSWYDVQEFINRLNSITNKKYRLPTEAEWEYAARGGNRSNDYKYAGSNNIDDVAWYNRNSEERTHPLGIKMPNELGIYDMSGNVWEWVNDLYGDYSDADQIDPQGSSFGDNRVSRGGSWYHGAVDCRVSSRNGVAPNERNPRLGFRLALSAIDSYF
jgi:hypothetical protein